MNVFAEFPKIVRVAKAMECIITEKIDGTNSQIVIEHDVITRVGSRNRFITPGKTTDNFGFAAWVERNAVELLTLGDGTHYGEWYGNGIQSGYGLKEKRFALFNAGRWTEERPSCCDVVPVLYEGTFNQTVVDATMARLQDVGSILCPGFMKPEGIIIYFPATKLLLKQTFKSPEGKWKDVRGS